MKNRGKFGEFEELGVRKSGAFFRRKSTELSSQNSALSSKGKVILLIACLFLLLFPLASAKDFIIRNESDSSDLYFVVNGTTGNVDVPSTGFFGCDGRFYKLNGLISISNLRIVSMIPGDLMVAGCFNFFEGGGGLL